MTTTAKAAPTSRSLELPEQPVALVTGAGSGIGAAIADRLAGLGAAVAAFDRDAVACERTVSELTAAGHRAMAIDGDVTRPDSLDSACDRVTRTLGAAPNLVVHNAGWTGPNVPFAELTAEDQARIIEVNYVGALNTVRSTLAPMIGRGGGSYLFVSSDAARIGTPKEAVYSGAKAAIVAFAKALTIELAGDGIRVNVVSPGSTDTPLIRGVLTPDQIERRIRANPMRRLGTPEDIADAVAFLVSCNAAYITGQVLSVNGGMTRLG